MIMTRQILHSAKLSICAEAMRSRPVSNFQALIDGQGKDLFEVVSALAPAKKSSGSAASVKSKTPMEHKDRQGPEEALAMVEW